jgi:transposase-like protein
MLYYGSDQLYSTRSKVLDRYFPDPAPPPPTPQLRRVITMPPQRRFGQEIAGNTQRRPNISPADRQKIIAKRECGVTVRELAAEFGRSEGAVKYTIQTYANTGTVLVHKF